MYIEIISDPTSIASAAPKRRRLPPDPERLNNARAKAALAVVEAFQAEMGTDPCDTIADLIGDLMHLCDRRPEFGDFHTQLERGVYAYLEETAQVGMYVETIEII